MSLVKCLFILFLSTPYIHSKSIIELEDEVPIKENELDLIYSEYLVQISSILAEHNLSNLKSVSSDCMGHTQEWIHQLVSFLDNSTEFRDRVPDVWAMHMVDAFAKIPEGILSGHVNSMGDYDECVGIRANNVNFSDKVATDFPNLPKTFQGLYCTTYLLPNLTEFQSISENRNGLREALSPSELLEFLGTLSEATMIIPSAGTCFPSSCSMDDVRELTTHLLRILKLSAILTPSPFYCTTGEKPDLDAGDISVTVFLGCLVSLCILAGIVDMWLQNRNPPVNEKGTLLQYFLAFSFYTNIRKWLTVQSSGDDLGCVHGIRVLSTGWVVLAHTWFMIAFIPNWNRVDVGKLYEDYSILTVLNAALAVDTFFVMSGMLVCYNLLKVLDRSNGKLNIPMFYLHRYLRITPTYGILVWIMATIFPYLGSGPFWGWMDEWAEKCEKNWWTNLLYVNNFVKTNERCQGESWFLANDFQFYIVSPIFIYPIWRWRKKGLIVLAVGTVASIIWPCLQTYWDDPILPTLIPSRPQGDWYETFYIKPYTRIQTYLIGIALGYLLYEKKGKRIRLSKVAVLCGWSLSTIISLGVLYGIAPWYDPKKEIPRIGGALYGGFHRFGWGLSISWIIFACVKGYGGLVNAFLSWSPFVPLGRLCLCVYLISSHLQMMFHLNFKQGITYDNYTMANLYLAHMFMSFMVGWACTMVMESPFLILEKLLFEGPVRPKKPILAGPIERYGIYYQKEETFNIQTK